MSSVQLFPKRETIILVVVILCPLEEWGTFEPMKVIESKLYT
eukprot:SAG31_NODE_42187_length_272_cov_1.485549_1_plen_41_part_10